MLFQIDLDSLFIYFFFSSTTDIARATTTMFLIMYCPERVGAKGDCQVNSGSKKRGRIVVIMCGIKIATAYFVVFGKRNRTPISISARPRIIRNKSNCISFKNGIFIKSAYTKSLAGDSPKSLSEPNQKKTTNNAM